MPSGSPASSDSPSAANPVTSTVASAPLPTAGLTAGFDYHPRTRVVFGAGTLGRLGELVREYGGHRVLLVTDPGIDEAGHPQRAIASLEEAGIDYVTFSDVRPNPTTEDVRKATEVAKANGIDFLVGLGGGSSMDCAKGANFLLTGGGQMEDYWGVGKATKPMLPMIAIPTTSGTGSEAQSFALISQEKTHTKMACGDPKAACRVAILDPDLTASMPRSVAAATAIDAMSHALETHVTTKRNPISHLFSRQSWKLLARSIQPSLLPDSNGSARAGMLLGAHLAGAAIENSMLGAAHALANPLTAHYDITHGLAVGVMLPEVIRFNAPVVNDLYGQLASDVKLCSADDPEAGEFLSRFVRKLLTEIQAPTDLESLGVKAEMLPQLAEDAKQQWTGRFNPRTVTTEDLLEIYRCTFSPQ